MQVHVLKNYREFSKKAAYFVASQVILKPDAVLGLATGSTPLGMYSNLVEMYCKGDVDFSRVRTFNLDEYLGLKADHPQSYHHYMFENFFNRVNIPRDNINLPPGKPEDTEKACREYDKAIARAGGIDLQVLGVGTNGHIGFNEPADTLYSETHVVDLAPETIEVNSRFFDSPGEVPRRAISMGVGSIMRAKKIILLASGENKREVIKKIAEERVSTEVPASLLHLHRDVTLILDEEAASGLGG